MAPQHFHITLETFISINGPLLILNFIANVFYAYCLIFPQPNGQRLKQPLKVLLGILVWSSIFYCLSLSMLNLVLNDLKSHTAFVVWLIMVSFVNNGTTCSVWLNFFYCSQIVPSQRAFLIWVKKNITSFIYVALFAGGILCFCNVAGNVAGIIISTSTNVINSTETDYHISVLRIASKVYLCMFKAYSLISLCIMMMSSISTVRYLHRHIRSMVQSGSGFSTPKTQSQMRVAVTGVSQGVLYFLLISYNLMESFSHIVSQQAFSVWISFTVLSLYITGTTVNLGVGQAAFRRKVVDVWRRVKTLSTKCN